jgi:hypothetical protein
MPCYSQPSLLVAPLRGRAAALAAAAAVSMLAIATPAAAGDLFYGGQVGAFYDNNVSRAQAAPDIVTDAGLVANASLGLAFPVHEYDTLSLSADARAQQYQRFHGLDVGGLGFTLSYHTKFGLGAYAPRARASLFTAGEAYGDAIRNGQRSLFTLEAGKRLTSQLDISGGFSADRFDAANVLPPLPRFSRDAFSLQGHSLFAHAEYAVNDRWLALLHLNFRRGDVLSSSRPNLPVFLASSAIVADPAFDNGYFAYKLAGRTASGRLGTSFALSPHSSFNLGFTREVTRSEGPLGYRSSLGDASFVYSY